MPMKNIGTQFTATFATADDLEFERDNGYVAPTIHATPAKAIEAQQAASDTMQRLRATFIMGRICGKTGALCEGSIDGDLSLLAVVADGTSYNSACYAFSSQLASHVAAAWVNTGPDQLNILRVADPHGFATFCLQQIYARDNHDGDTPQSSATLCGKYLRNFNIAKLRDQLELAASDQLVIANINKRLSNLISIAKPQLLRKAISAQCPQVQSLSDVVASFSLLMDNLQRIEAKLIAQLTKNGLTPTLLRQQREKNGGSSAMAASYNRESRAAKQKWIRYIADYDRSFATQIWDTLIMELTADDLQMPRNEQSFTDVTISPTKLAVIKLQIEKKRNTKVFDDILGEFDLADIAMDLDK